MIVRATVTSSSMRTDSSTAWAFSMSLVPTITVGMPRAVNRRMSAPQGTPAIGASWPSSSLERGAHGLRPRVIGSASRPGANAPPLHSSWEARPPRFERVPRLRQVRPDGHAEPALELEPVGHHARPLARGDLADEQRVRQLQLAHQRMRDVRVDGDLVALHRRMDGHVLVDRGHAREALGRVGRSPVHDALEGQRSRLGADDAQAGRLGQQRGVEARRRAPARRTCRARRPPRTGRPSGPPRARRRRRLDRRQRVQRGDHRALHVDRPAAVQAAVLDRAGPRAVPPWLGALPDDVDVAVERQPAGPGAGQRRGHAAAARRAAPPRPGWPGWARRAARSCACRSVSRPAASREFGKRLERVSARRR